MKKLRVFLAVCVLLTLVGCGKKPIKMEDHQWQLMYMQMSAEPEIVACSPAYAEVFSLEDTMTVVDVTATAKDGKLTLINHTLGTTMEFEYEYAGQGGNRQGTSYNFTKDGQTGFITAYNGSVGKMGEIGAGKERPMLFIMAGQYSLTFMEVGGFEADFPLVSEPG